MQLGLFSEKSYQDFRSIILGSRKQFPLDRKILNAALFASTIVTIVLTVSVFILRTSMIERSIILGGSILIVSLYFLARRNTKSNWITWVFFYLALVNGLLIWRFSTGITGLAPFIIIGITSLIPIIIPPKGYLIAFLSVAVAVVMMYYSTLNFIDIIPQPDMTTSFVHYIMIGIFAVASGLAFMNLLFITIHRRNEDRISKLLELLDEVHNLGEDRRSDIERTYEKRNTLQGVIPICGYCKRIRDDDGTYESVEAYVEKHSEANLPHMFCPDCAKEQHPGLYEDNPDL
jgi:hypothetical protein